MDDFVVDEQYEEVSGFKEQWTVKSMVSDEAVEEYDEAVNAEVLPVVWAVVDLAKVCIRVINLCVHADVY